jgi:hypothetical protein
MLNADLFVSCDYKVFYFSERRNVVAAAMYKYQSSISTQKRHFGDFVNT